MANDRQKTWDAIVVGGGAAGLSAALVLGRARRSVLVVDAGEPSNRFAHGIGGLLGHNERPPAELYAAGRAEVLAHPTAAILHGTVSAGRAHADADAAHPARFSLATADGEPLAARTVVLATGMDYGYPDLPGFAERWGNSVFHCPFCHGWEVRGRPLGVLGDGPAAMHRALLLTSWSDDVTVYTAAAGTTTDEPALTAEQRAQLAAAGVKIEPRPVVAATGGDAPALGALQLADGSSVACGGLLIATTLRQRSTLATELGAALAEANPVVIDPVAVDARQGTSVPGLFAAGDVSTQMPQITGAIASGVMAGAAAVGLLTGAA